MRGIIPGHGVLHERLCCAYRCRVVQVLVGHEVRQDGLVQVETRTVTRHVTLSHNLFLATATDATASADTPQAISDRTFCNF